MFVPGVWEETGEYDETGEVHAPVSEPIVYDHWVIRALELGDFELDGRAVREIPAGVVPTKLSPRTIASP